MPFSTLDIESFRPRLRYKVRSQIGFRSCEVEDIVQETIFRFLVAMRAGRLRNEDVSGAYLYGICQNVIFEYSRRAGREEPLREDHPEAVNPGLTDAERMELTQSIGALMEQLSPRDRLLLRACYLDELKRKDVMAATGMTGGQLRVVLHRARKRFRELTQTGPAASR